MALVRCPIHKIPYNDENPRGCPACARERDGADAAAAIQELARVSRAMHGVQEAPPTAPPPGAKPRPSTATSRPSRAAAWPVTEPPKPPATAVTWWDRLLRRVRDRRALTTLGGIVLVLVIAIIYTTGPTFTPLPDPLAAAGTPLPLPVEPGRPITSVFAILGEQPPQPVPDAPRLARYRYGSGIEIDAINDIVYAVSFSVTNRVWHGLRPGTPARQVEGALALLGAPREQGPSAVPPPRRVGKYEVYPSLDQRPRRTLVAEVRPPNGCFDVQVDLQPRAAGILRRGSERYAVIGAGSPTLDWIATRIRIINRAVRGPYVEGLGC